MTCLTRRLTLHSLAASALLLIGVVHADDEGDEIYQRLRSLSALEISSEGTTVSVVFDGDASDASRARALNWVHRALTAINSYFGRLPYARVGLLIQWRDGQGVGGGTSWGYAGSIVRVRLGRDTPIEKLDDDWVLIHELVHTCLPSMPSQHLWMQEGCASYVEPIARVQSGERSEEATWAEFVGGMSRGLPQAGDAGLDRTHTWGRTYWGGALYCLLADVAIREATANRAGLQQALRAISRESGGNRADWSMERFVTVGDAGTGSTVLKRLYLQMGQAPMSPDLDALWDRLGIVAADGHVRLDDQAPQASIRRAIISAQRSA